MKIITATIYFVLYLGISLMAQTGANEIEWSTKKLSWSDFKGTQKAKRAVAMTHSGIFFRYNEGSDGILNITIVSNFNKKESWVKPAGRTDEVLRHEQLHFDITELYARVLRRYFSEQSFTAKMKLSAVVNRYYEEQMQELNRMENKYDSETKNGTRPDAQRQWEECISLELKKLEAFTQHTFVRRISK